MTYPERPEPDELHDFWHAKPMARRRPIRTRAIALLIIIAIIAIAWGLTR